MTLDDLTCETNWGTGSFPFLYSCARSHRVLPNFFTVDTTGNLLEYWTSALLVWIGAMSSCAVAIPLGGSHGAGGCHGWNQKSAGKPHV